MSLVYPITLLMTLIIAAAPDLHAYSSNHYLDDLNVSSRRSQHLSSINPTRKTPRNVSIYPIVSPMTSIAGANPERRAYSSNWYLNIPNISDALLAPVLHQSHQQSPHNSPSLAISRL
ncbi:hypothetical protein PISMIDRAFT_19706 [Pisolithus microcarpus 441]|uniref:Uncharacterized protein n=1 Tax=Pisolithus microcarpus 441 TaxID=765257 RepID=A0A0C9YLQ4_9AGAM|nr:hypothetical protein BKA83DRAFT_19706 [Pisolithus microcarpus]KIK11237.1 hypothetical protein PISMIDRAFT_19706 [Pisolithus microcarpus 441]